MKIKRFWIKNFRCYKNVEIQLHESLLLITGVNDGGKTAFLDALRLLCTSGSSGLPDIADFRFNNSDDNDTEKMIEIGGEFSQDLDESIVTKKVFSLENGEVTPKYFVQKPIPNNSVIADAARNYTKWTADKQKDFLSKLDRPLGKNKEERSTQIKEIINEADKTLEWVQDSLPKLPEIRLDRADDSVNPVNQVQTMIRDAISQQSTELKTKKGYGRIEKDIKNIAKDAISQLESIFSRYEQQNSLKISPDIEVNLSSGVSIRDILVSQHGLQTPLAKLGSAKRRKLQLALWELRLDLVKKRESETPLLLLYDEPDTHFDYDAQRKLFSVLKGLSEQKNVQVIVVTHALSLIDRVSLDNILHIHHDFDASGVLEARLQSVGDWKEIVEVARSLGVRNHVVLNACLLIVEGEAEDFLIPELFFLYKGYDLRSVGVEIIKDMPRGKDYSWSLGKHALRYGRHAFFLLDSDAKIKSGTKKEITEAKINDFNAEHQNVLIEEGINLLFLGDLEMEDLFPNTILSEALERFIAGIPDKPLTLSRSKIKSIVSKGRKHADGITKGLQTHLNEHKLNNSEHRVKLSKTKLAEKICEVLNEKASTSAHSPIPKKLRKAFDLIEKYAGN